MIEENNRLDLEKNVFHSISQKFYPADRFKNLFMEVKCTDVFEETNLHTHTMIVRVIYII